MLKNNVEVKSIKNLYKVLKKRYLMCYICFCFSSNVRVCLCICVRGVNTSPLVSSKKIYSFMRDLLLLYIMYIAFKG